MEIIRVKNLVKTYKTIQKENGLFGYFKNLVKPKYKEFDAVKGINSSSITTLVILALLEHPEERVRMGAAAFCIKIRIYIEKATAVLDNIIDTSNDSTIIFSAEMILKHML